MYWMGVSPRIANAKKWDTWRVAFFQPPPPLYQTVLKSVSPPEPMQVWDHTAHGNTCCVIKDKNRVQLGMLFSSVAFLKRSQCRFWKWASTHLFKLNIVVMCLEILTEFLQIFFYCLRYFQYLTLQMSSRCANFLGFCHLPAFPFSLPFPLSSSLLYPSCIMLHFLAPMFAENQALLAHSQVAWGNSSTILPTLVNATSSCAMPCEALTRLLSSWSFW